MVISFLCCSLVSIKDLHRTFSTLGIEYVNIEYQKAIPYHLDQEHTMFILDSDCPNTRKRVEEANLRKLFRFPYRWMILESNQDDRTSYESRVSFENTSSSNVPQNYINHDNTSPSKNYYQNLNSPGGSQEFKLELNSDTTVKAVHKEITENATGIWEFPNSISSENDTSTNISSESGSHFMKADDKYKLPSLFQNISILVDSDVIIVEIEQTSGNFVLYAIYKLPSSEELVFENQGVWSSCSGYLDERTQRISALRRRNLQLAPFTASFVINDKDTINHLTDFRNQHIDSITKSNYYLVTHIMEFVNGSHAYTFVDSWVGNQKTTYGGMVGELVAGRAELGGTPLFMMASRLEVLEYIAMTTPTTAAFVFRKPPLSHGANIFALPFHWKVWAATSALFLLGAFLLYASAWWEKSRNKDQVDATQLRADPGEVVVATLGALCQQGSPKEPKLLSGRQVFFAMLLSLMFLYTAYSANIVAMLQSSSDSIRSLEDLLHSGLKLAVDDTVYNRYLFPTETEPIRRAIWEQRIAPKGTEPKFMNIEKGVALVRQGLFGFHMETGVGYKVVGDTFREEEKCDLQEVAFLRVSDPWFAIAKHSPYREMVKIGTRRAQEAGLCARSRLRVYAVRPKCSGARATFAGAALRDCAPAMRALAAGYGIALGLLLAECSLKWFISRGMQGTN